MKRKIKFLFAVCFFFFGVGSVFSQTKDAGLWTSISVDKKITQALSFGISEELRFNENVSELGTFFTDAGLTYRITDDFRFAVNYRFINKRKLDDSYSKRHRYYFDVSYRKKTGKLTPVLRVRIQSQYTDVLSSDQGGVPDWYLRPKFSLRYNLKGAINPYISSELFYTLDKRVFDNVRYTFGVERNLGDKLKADLFFLHQREFNVKKPEYDYIWGFGLTYSL